MKVYDLGEGYRVTLAASEVNAFRNNSGCDTIPAGFTISALYQKQPEMVLRHNVPRVASPTDKAAILKWMAAEAKRRLGL